MAPPGEGGEDTNPKESSMASAQTNGLDEPWDRVWSVDEMRGAAGNWSLACDAGMLRFLQDFSQRIVSRTHEIQGQVNSLVHEANLTDVRLNNAFNDFTMLANTQFVENRVYDEDVTQEETDAEKKDEQEKTKEEREAELIPKIAEAMRLGVSVLDSAFDKLDVDEAHSDSDEDGKAPRRTAPILEPKNPYLHRPLPYLIGSPAFLQDDDVGLVDLPSEAEEELDQGKLSESGEEGSGEEDSSAGEQRRSARDSEEQQPGAAGRGGGVFESGSESESEDDDLFGDKKSESGSEGEDAKTSQEPKSFADELAAKISGASAPKPEAEEKKERKSSEKKKRTESKSKKKSATGADADLFGAPPADEDEFSSTFGKSGGLFSGGGGLFDDEPEEEGGLFGDVVKEKEGKKTEEQEEEEAEETPPKEKSRPRTKSGKAVPSGGVSIFGAGADDLFSSVKKKAETDSDEPEAEVKATPSGGGGGLFDDEDDLFSIASQKKTEPKKAAAAAARAKPAVDLFGDAASSSDDDGDLFAAPKPDKKPAASQPAVSQPAAPAGEKTQKKLPTGAVSMFGGAANPLTEALKKQNRATPSDDEADDDWSDDDKLSSRDAKSSGLVPPSGGSSGAGSRKSPSPSPSSGSLFAEEPEDDLFKTTPSAPKPTDSKAKSAKASGLFGGDEEDGDDLFSITAKPKAKAGEKTKPRATSLLFEDEHDDADADLFPPAGGAQSAAAPPAGGASAAPAPAGPAGSGRKKPVGGVSLFGDGGADLFAETKRKVTGGKDDVSKEPEKKAAPAEEKAREPTAAPASRKMTLSLFDADEDDGDLFAAPSGAKAPQPKPAAEADTGRKPRSKSRMLFEDEDVLFGGTPAEAPPVDLFAPGSPVSPTKDKDPPKFADDDTPTPKMAIKGATTSASTTDIFTASGSDEDDADLFAAATKPKPRVPEAKPSAPEGKPSERAEGPPPTTQQKKVAVKGATLTESSTDRGAGAERALFGDKSDSGDEDLFSAGKGVAEQSRAPAETKEAPPPEAKPRKPPGAVSMFGGVDIAAAVKKRAGSALSPDTPPAPSQATTSDPLSPAGGSPPAKPAGWKPVAPPGASRKPAAPPTREKPRAPSLGEKTEPPEKVNKPFKPAVGGIGKLQASLAINPAALLPGAAPPTRDEAPAGVGFDEPAQAQTLHTAQKERARIQTKRRPPTRHARRAAADASQSEPFSDSGASATPVPMDTSAAPAAESVSKAAPVTSQALFGNEDLLTDVAVTSDKSSGAIPKVFPKKDRTDSEGSRSEANKTDQPEGPKRAAPVPEETKDTTKSANKEKKKKVAADYDDDIFSAAAKSTFKASQKPKADEDLFGSKKPPSNQKPLPVASMFEPPPLDDDDIFSSGTKKKKSAIAQVLDDDDDDIFAGSSVFKSSKPTTTKTEVKTQAVPPSVAEDDIFADASINKPKETKPTRAAAPPVDDDIFAGSTVASEKPKPPPLEADSDIFGSTDEAKASKATKRPKKATTRDEDLFRDDTDIFADLPPTGKPREKKAKTKKEKSIFKDDVDDIFAESASKPKTKKTTKKPAAGGAKGEAAGDIFSSEAPSIFDDPLNAMK